MVPAYFGTAAARDYRYHAIIGLSQNVPKTAPWLPTQPLVNGTCTGYSGALGAGLKAQGVAILTGGLRFPLCELGSFDVVFDTIAQGIVATVGIACSFPAPTKTAGGSAIDPNTIVLEYTPGAGGAKQTFSQVKGLADCKPQAFYIASGQVTLCPDTCTTVKSDGKAKIDVTYGCDVGFKP